MTQLVVLAFDAFGGRPRTVCEQPLHPWFDQHRVGGERQAERHLIPLIEAEQAALGDDDRLFAMLVRPWDEWLHQVDMVRRDQALARMVENPAGP